LGKDKELAALKSDIESYVSMLGQVAKHLKTLTKYLRDCVQKTENPVMIEHTVRQIKSIERLHYDVKKAMKTNSKKNPSGAATQHKDLESVFMSASSCGRASIGTDSECMPPPPQALALNLQRRESL